MSVAGLVSAALLLVAAGLLVYLLVALLDPERF
jgi:K+-transporting ATPase KdpF subunit